MSLDFSMNRYQRQICLPEMGLSGQQKLSEARVLCVGAGGLGSPLLYYLAAAGVGHLGFVDHDRVDVSNLQRQILFSEADKGRYKAEVAKERLSALNPHIRLTAYETRLQAYNAMEILKDYDVIVDGTDNFASLFLLNDCCLKLAIPLVYGSILRFEGQVAVFWGRHGPCYRCLYPEIPTAAIPNCAEAGVIGSIAGIIGSIQALEVIKLCLGLEHCNQQGLEPLMGKIMIIDGADLSTRKLNLQKNAQCPACSQNPADLSLMDYEPGSCELDTSIRQLSLDEIGQLPQVVLIDVREPMEWSNGYLPEARNLPLSYLKELDHPVYDELLKEAYYLLYCQKGIRSQQAAQLLKQQGYENLSVLTGGLDRYPDCSLLKP